MVMVEKSPHVTFEGLIQIHKGEGLRVIRNVVGDMIVLQQPLNSKFGRGMFVSLRKDRPDQLVPNVCISVHTYKRGYASEIPDTHTDLTLHPEENGVGITVKKKSSLEDQKKILSKVLAGLEIFDAFLNLPSQAKLNYNFIASDNMKSGQLIDAGPTSANIQKSQEKYRHMIEVLRLAR